VALAALTTWLFMAFVVRISSLSALTAAVLAPVYGWWFQLPGVYQGALWFMVVLLIWRHRSNIRNLLAGAEDKIGADDKP
jgi:glycerol-3-phosphate acyltransferase PlsY